MRTDLLRFHTQNKENTGIEGRLLMLDDVTPHVAVVVHAVTPLP